MDIYVFQNILYFNSYQELCFSWQYTFQNIHGENTQRKSLPLKQILLKRYYRKISDASYQLKKEEKLKQNHNQTILT